MIARGDAPPVLQPAEHDFDPVSPLVRALVVADDCIVDVMEELVRFTILTRAHSGALIDRYSERKAANVAIDAANAPSNIAIAPDQARK